MPGLPLVARETTRSRTADQMCRQNSRIHLSPEEALAAEESLSVYCKPVELYNILQRRALHNPPFLQRCLHYKIQARHKHRIQLTMSLSANMNDEVQSHSLFPLYILLTRPVVDTAVGEHSAVFRLSRVCILPTFSEFGRRDQTEAGFVVPEIRKFLTDDRMRNLTIILLSHGGGSSNERHVTTDGNDALTFPCEIFYLYLGIITYITVSKQKRASAIWFRQLPTLGRVNLTYADPSFIEIGLNLWRGLQQVTVKQPYYCINRPQPALSREIQYSEPRLPFITLSKQSTLYHGKNAWIYLLTRRDKLMNENKEAKI